MPIGRLFVTEVRNHAGEPVTIRGWIYRLRVLAKTTFIIVRDCTGDAQCVASTDSVRDLRLKLDDAIEVQGVVRTDERAKSGFEIDVSRVVVLNRAANVLPFNSSSDISDVSTEIRMEYRPLALRNDRVGDIFRIQAAILRLFREYLTSQHFTEIISSKIVAGGTEGGTNLFEIKSLSARPVPSHAVTLSLLDAGRRRAWVRMRRRTGRRRGRGNRLRIARRFNRRRIRLVHVIGHIEPTCNYRATCRSKTSRILSASTAGSKGF